MPELTKHEGAASDEAVGWLLSRCSSASEAGGAETELSLSLSDAQRSLLTELAAQPPLAAIAAPAVHRAFSAASGHSSDDASARLSFAAEFGVMLRYLRATFEMYQHLHVRRTRRSMHVCSGCQAITAALGDCSQVD